MALDAADARAHLLKAASARCAPGARRLDDVPEGVMAKSQLRSGREPKKPKKEKPKSEPTTTAGSLWATLERSRSGKKR
jgi:hypothetical protein